MGKLALIQAGKGASGAKLVSCNSHVGIIPKLMVDATKKVDMVIIPRKMVLVARRAVGRRDGPHLTQG